MHLRDGQVHFSFDPRMSAIGGIAITPDTNTGWLVGTRVLDPSKDDSRTVIQRTCGL